MQLQIRKTDSRFTGHDRYQYYVKIKPSFNESAMEEFYKLRVWCWETWGPSREVNANKPREYHENIYLDDVNMHWSWLNDEWRARLYLAGKDEVAFFKLRWS